MVAVPEIDGATIRWSGPPFDREAVRYGAATHGTPTTADRTIEDLLVSLADNIWKGRRNTDLEAPHQAAYPING